MSNQENSKKKFNHFKSISKNYEDLNKTMANEVKMTIEHDGLMGNFREEMWLNFFRRIIPKKYTLSQGVMIIDSHGKISNEVDIAVYDEQYTPYVMQYGSLKYIPIEAVVIVIQCKSRNITTKNIVDWAKIIEELKSNNSGINRIISGLATGLTNKIQSQTMPIKILACMNSESKEKAKQNWSEYFDIILTLNENEELFKLHIQNEDKTLGWWSKKLNAFGEFRDSQEYDSIKVNDLKKQNWMKLDKDGTLTNTLKDLKIEGNDFLSLNFQLNQLLMLINNPMLFPHFAYADAFKKALK